jgi:DNA-binding NtrC family response regulator
LLASFLPDLSPSPHRTGPPAATFDLDAFIDSTLTADARDLYAQIRQEVDRRLLTRVLAFTKNNHRQAARILGVARQTMQAKLLSLGMRVTPSAEPDDDESQDA